MAHGSYRGCDGNLEYAFTQAMHFVALDQQASIASTLGRHDDGAHRENPPRLRRRRLVDEAAASDIILECGVPIAVVGP
jgi:hypothetical protein